MTGTARHRVGSRDGSARGDCPFPQPSPMGGGGRHASKTTRRRKKCHGLYTLLPLGSAPLTRPAAHRITYEPASQFCPLLQVVLGLKTKSAAGLGTHPGSLLGRMRSHLLPCTADDKFTFHFLRTRAGLSELEVMPSQAQQLFLLHLPRTS